MRMKITVNAENYLKNLEAALLSPFYNAEVSPEKSFDLVSVFGEEAKSNHPLIPIVFSYMERCNEKDRDVVNTAAQFLVMTLMRVFRCGSFNPREYSLEILQNRSDLMIAYSKKATKKEVSSDLFDKDKRFLAEFWYAWNCHDSYLSDICCGDPDKASRMETCREFLHPLLDEILAEIYSIILYGVKSLVEDKVAELKVTAGGNTVNDENVSRNSQVTEEQAVKFGGLSLE
jgi:hypothetical protein